jgi:hypothetical protein
MTSSDSLMSFDDFLVWCQNTLELSFVPEPEFTLRGDLELDDLEFFLFMAVLHRVVENDSTIRRDVYEGVDTIRDLYLYYLTVMQMPKE